MKYDTQKDVIYFVMVIIVCFEHIFTFFSRISTVIFEHVCICCDMKYFEALQQNMKKLVHNLFLLHEFWG